MIDLGFPPELLYAAWKATVTFTLRDGSQKSGTGTAFAVQTTAGALSFVTARHLLDPALALPKHVGATLDRVVVHGRNYGGARTHDEEIKIELIAPPTFPSDPGLDVAALALKPPFQFNGKARIESFLRQELLAERDEFDEDIRAGDFLAAPGFSSLPFVDTDRPVLLTGVVASNPKYPVSISRSAGPPARAVLYQSLSRSGLSGAPVFATQRGIALGDGISGPPHRPTRVVGVNGGGFVDATSTPLQFSYFTRSDAVLSLLDASS